MKIQLSLVLFLLPFTMFCQSVEQIKADRAGYIWGEGSGSTVNKADQQALEMLISQISVEVESKFSLLKEEMLKTGKSDIREECHQMVNTYSSATLNFTERVVVANDPQTKVFRYIKRSEVERIFQQRKERILDYVNSANNSLRNLQLADALKNYYWALSLLRSHPEGDAMTFQTADGKQRLLLGYLPEQINVIFAGLHFNVAGVKDEPGVRNIVLEIQYNGQPVQNFDYSYWTGRDWSPVVGAKGGIGYMDFYGEDASSHEASQIKAEYIFAGEARIDREIEVVLERLDPIPFRNAYFNLRFDNSAKSIQTLSGKSGTTVIATNTTPATSAFAALQLSRVTETAAYQQKLDQVMEAINTGKYEKAEPLFTDEGYEVYTKLITYGKARVLSNDSVRIVRLNNTVICRGPRMSFGFNNNNNRKFVEDVVFHFNPDGKIETLSFGLNEQAIASIIYRKTWSEAERLTIINFLEHYKTAYALKRLDFISSIFADDALIITGSMVKVKPNIENPFQGNAIVKYNRYNKVQYIKALEQTFASNEFINIGFEESNIRKGGKEGDMYGIQIKQNYYSTNYGDQGYLFLLLDFKNPDEPLIHVRTWQPQKNSDGSIYGIEDF